MRAKRRPGVVDDLCQRVGEVAAVEIIDHGMATVRRPAHLEDQIGAHRRTEENTPALWLMGLAGLTIERDDGRAVTAEAERHDARAGSVDETQAKTLARAHGQLFGHPTIDGDGVADAACHRRFHAIAETAGDLRILRQTPVL